MTASTEPTVGERAADPASTFVGYDLDSTAIDGARNRVADLNLTNLSFETRDAATLSVTEPFDAVFVQRRVRHSFDRNFEHNKHTQCSNY